MATVLDLITRCLKDIGAIAISENPTQEEAQDALSILNDMLDSWSTESLMIYINSPQVFPFLEQQTATIGPGGDYNTARPVRVQSAYNRDTQNAGTDIPIYVTGNYQEYADIITKATQSDLVTVIYYDGGFPLQTLYFWPVQNSSQYQLVLWTWDQLTTFANVNTEVVFPPGYNRCIRSNLALELCASYGKTPSPTLVQTATESKAQIKRINLVTPQMGFDSSITGRGQVFNWLTGDTV